MLDKVRLLGWYSTGDTQIPLFGQLSTQISAKARTNRKTATLKERAQIQMQCFAMRMFHRWSSEAHDIKMTSCRQRTGNWNRKSTNKLRFFEPTRRSWQILLDTCSGREHKISQSCEHRNIEDNCHTRIGWSNTKSRVQSVGWRIESQRSKGSG